MTNSSSPSSTTTTTTPTIGLVHGSNDRNSSVMIKLLWASKLCNIELQAQAVPSSSSSSSSFFLHNNKQQHPALILLNQEQQEEEIVGGGGNSMVLAMSQLQHTNNQNNSSHTLLQRVKMEDWLEFERTQLRHANEKQVEQQVLTRLVPALQHHHHSHFHLVGTADSIADVCIVTTLLQLAPATLASFPECVRMYVKHHRPAYEAAQAAVEGFNLATTTTTTASSSSFSVDLSEPRMFVVLRELFGATIQGVFGADIDLPANMVTKCQNPKHGDYQCTVAMPTFAALKKKGNTEYASPQQVAQAIIQGIGQDHPVVMNLQVNGPGFVVMTLRPSFLQHHVNALLTANALPLPKVTPKTCVVDFSSPNIAKEMHVGHLRSTIIGESVCRILEAVGHTVHRVNHVGDWGTQFGMLIQYLKESEQDESSSSASITDLTNFYKKAKERFDDSPEFKKLAQLNVVKLQSGDPECLKIWKMLCDTSRGEFEKVYSRLDVTLNECGESFYNDKIPAVIQEFEKAGLLESEEGGAKVVRVDKFKVPLMLQKSDGGYGYDSTDAAALKYRLFDLKADRIIVITDFTQADHFKMVYGAGRNIGWVKDGQQRLEHIGFGTVQGEDGKRFKTRSGETVRLVDLLDEAVHRMEQSLRERIAEGKSGITEAEVHQVAEAIGYGAVKYYDLRRNPTSNYKFSYDQMLDTKGDTAVYLLYARVRLESIAAKAKTEFNIDVQELLKSGEQIIIEHPSERNLALFLMTFADMYEKTLEELYPCNLCEYVYKLSIAVAEFATQCKVLGSPEMKSRLLLCYASTLAMGQCFELLGIRNVTRI